jgi:hypothetical protein
MRVTVLLAIPLALVVAGCGAADEPEPAAAPQTATLAIEQVLDTSGSMYIEGALWQLQILDANGTEVFAGDLDTTEHAESLVEGTYTVKSALKPCIGTCGYTSEPEGACEAEVAVVAPSTKVRVDVAAGRDCTISTL